MGLGVLPSCRSKPAPGWATRPPRDALATIPEIQELHFIAGPATLLAKVRTATTEGLQDVPRRIFTVEGVTGTNTIVVLDAAFERPLDTGGRVPDTGD
ncbi:Lrp/AsnC ligand binding domain-containing protein [Lentzea atacamensis]|uniref:Lrp/AsnC ligand binding domain-containing protein n=1 Tax=Lentzea atacamensis TaxID=531938 RepID=UPI001F283603|nr:Lrp/AsnC ligand binding domain-containing protein [Lentzea atacamensis]